MSVRRIMIYKFYLCMEFLKIESFGEKMVIYWPSYSITIYLDIYHDPRQDHS